MSYQIFNNKFIFTCDFMIECRNISKGKAEGELIVSSEAISFLGGVDPETGVVIDPNHELKGESIKGKVLFIPGGKGSTVGSYVIFQMMKKALMNWLMDKWLKLTVITVK